MKTDCRKFQIGRRKIKQSQENDKTSAKGGVRKREGLNDCVV